MRTLSLLLFFCLALFTAEAATVETVQVYSQSMRKDVETVIITPNNRGLSYPVVYLLHGYGGDAQSWIGIKPDLPELAERYKLIIVCPDGKNSWYWDSPNNPSYHYETFVSTELVGYIDKNYPTLSKREGRAITGLSMGGHGGLWLSFRHPNVFGAGGSMSGGVDIRPFPKNWEMSKQLGEYEQNRDVWDRHTVINQINKIKDGQLAIIIDCGYEDFFFDANNALHARLLEAGINHDYIVRPGKHDAPYWRNAIEYQLLYFHLYFERE